MLREHEANKFISICYIYQWKLEHADARLPTRKRIRDGDLFRNTRNEKKADLV